MKKRTKFSVFACLCVLVLAVGVLTACGGKDNKSEEESTGSAVESNLTQDVEQAEDDTINQEDQTENEDTKGNDLEDDTAAPDGVGSDTEDSGDLDDSGTEGTSTGSKTGTDKNNTDANSTADEGAKQNSAVE